MPSNSLSSWCQNQLDKRRTPELGRRSFLIGTSAAVTTVLSASIVRAAPLFRPTVPLVERVQATVLTTTFDSTIVTLDSITINMDAD